MLTITKIFFFEAAHAITNHKGKCRNVHGHSYELHVTVSADHLDEMNMIMDFSDLKEIVNRTVVHIYDHALVLNQHSPVNVWAKTANTNVLWLDNEPTAEYMLLDMKERMIKELPTGIILCKLDLYETRSNFATWQKS